MPPRWAITLIALANHAGPDGSEAFPSVERMTRYTRLSRRTVQRALRSLEELGLVKPGSTHYRDARIERADLRPQVYDLVLSAGLSTGTGTGRQHDARNVLEPKDQPSSAERTGGRSAVPAECGECDARPGDPVSARVLWADEDRTRSVPCPRCAPQRPGGAR